VDGPAFGQPASEDDLQRLHRDVLGPAPDQLDDLLRATALGYFTWTLTDAQGDQRWGGFDWNPMSIRQAESARLTAVREGWFGPGSDAAAGNPDAESIWADAFAWLEMRNGDALGISRNRRAGAVVYLSHDGDPLHGEALGPSLSTFLERWGALGWPGPESWQLDQFLGPEGLDPTSPRSQTWVGWLLG
jgi:hypothetical protein